MEQNPSDQLLQELQKPDSKARVTSLLKELKNQVIGHEQHKKKWVTSGILPVLVKHLQRFQSKPAIEGSPFFLEARLSILVIIESIARGGTSFHDALLASNVVDPLLQALSPKSNPPAHILSALRTIHSIAEVTIFTHSSPKTLPNVLFTRLFSPPIVQFLAEIIVQSSPSFKVQHQITLAASIISKACFEDAQKQSLANAGVLNALALKLANYIVSKGYVFVREDASSRRVPPPAPSTAKLAPILEAIACIIEGSKFRAAQLLHSPAINAVLYWETHNEFLNRDRKPNLVTMLQLSVSPRLNTQNPIENLLPSVPHSVIRLSSTSSLAFPPLSSLSAFSNNVFHTPSGWAGNNLSQEESDDDDIKYVESPLISFLLRLAREETGLSRLYSTSVLAALYKSGFVRPDREFQLAAYIIPYLVNLLDEEIPDTSFDSSSAPAKVTERVTMGIKETTPTIIASLVTDNPVLQKAAVDAGVIGKITALLKKSFDSAPRISKQDAWKVAVNPWRAPEESKAPRTSQLGQPGNPSSLNHRMKIRESALRAIGSLTANTEDYRKSVVDQGITPYIVGSLKTTYRSSHQPPSPDPTAVKPQEPMRPFEENSEGVLIQSSSAVKALARSINVLRTDLIDAGVASPLFRLLLHPNDEVKVAATAAICNLVLEFSPMREPIVEAGALDTLCQHAHTSNPRLRLNALWALKNVVYLADNTIRQKCLDMLGNEWLIGLIESDRSATFTHTTPGITDLPSGSHPGADSQGADIMDFESTKELFHDDREEVLNIADSVGIFDRTEANGSSVGAGLSRLPLGEWDEQTQTWEASVDGQSKTTTQTDILIQEQALSLLRNAICPPGTNEMIDVILSKYTSERLFATLTSKLRPNYASISAKGKQVSLNEPSRLPIPPREEIVVAVTAILIHIAAGNPRQRQLLLSQTEMFRHLLPYLDYHKKEVRVNVIWIVINLTWVDSDTDRHPARQRALELKRLGFQAKLERMEQEPDIDTQERIKTALYQLRVSPV